MKTKHIQLISPAYLPVYAREKAASFLSSSPMDDSSFYLILPGFCDVHVHLREPGFSHKETIKTGTAAAARGGYTDVFSMPNLSPVPDSREHLAAQLALIERDACIGVHPLGAMTVGEKGECLSDMEGIAPNVIGFSDDGRGVQSEALTKLAMEKAKALGKIICAHCEVNDLLKGGYIHDGAYAKANGHKGICSESEYAMVERDLFLAEKTGVAYHVCHVSTKESVELIRRAKQKGVDVTCETAPHYLLLTDADLKEHGRFKMNPPLRAEADRDALLEGILDGTVDMIATDHAPHTAEEKSRGLAGSPFGVVGLECAFPALYTHLVLKQKLLTVEQIAHLMAIAPRKRFGLAPNGFSIWEVSTPYPIDPAEFLSQGKSTPFEGMEVYGQCLYTEAGGNTVWQKK